MKDQSKSAEVAMAKFNFHGDELDVIPREGTVLVVVRRVCEALGIDESGQRQKLTKKGWACAEFISAQMSGESQRREVFCIPIDALPMWLATIEPSRVAECVRPKLELYQRECARVLADHFLGRRDAPRANASQPSAVDLVTALAPLLTQIVSAVVLAANAPILRRLDAVEVATTNSAMPINGVIGNSTARAVILDPIMRVAGKLTGASRKETAFKSARIKADVELRRRLRWPASRWQDFPQVRIGEATVALREMEARAQEAATERFEERQTAIPFGMGHELQKPN